jgi:hypothetical protein
MNTILDKKDFIELSGIRQPTCISIFISTHRAGEAVLNDQDRIAFKNKVRAVKEELENRDCPPRQIDSLTAPLEKLVEDDAFWRHQSDGLAVFAAEDFFRYFTLPIRFESFHHLSEGFYLKPLVPMFTGDGRFFILALTLEGVDFYEGTRHSITEVRVNDLTPANLKEVVGADFDPSFLQFRSQQEGHGQASFHGHGSWQEDRKDEILQYMRAINDGLNSMLHDEDAPMLLAGQDFEVALYRKANTYPLLQEPYISGNPADMDSLLLHEKAWELIRPYFDQSRQEKMDLFGEFSQTSRTQVRIEKVVPAALEGRVDTLFLENRSDVFGLYDPASRSVTVSKEHKPPHVSLLNLVAIQTILHGGMVYLLEPEEMPYQGSKVNALLRYEFPAG